MRQVAPVPLDTVGLSGVSIGVRYDWPWTRFGREGCPPAPAPVGRHILAFYSKKLELKVKATAHPTRSSPMPLAQRGYKNWRPVAPLPCEDFDPEQMISAIQEFM